VRDLSGGGSLAPKMGHFSKESSEGAPVEASLKHVPVKRGELAIAEKKGTVGLQRKSQVGNKEKRVEGLH